VVGIKIDASTDLESPAGIKSMSLYSTMNLGFDLVNLVTFEKRMHELRRQKHRFKTTWISIYKMLLEIWETLLSPLQMPLSACYWQLNSF
jgi:hypothetical protein